MSTLPRLLITMGDVAGVGPEIIARAWPELCTVCRPVVVGDPSWLARALRLVGSPEVSKSVQHLAEVESRPDFVPCLSGSLEDLDRVQPGRVDAAAGKAAYDFLCMAIDRTLAGE